jgi:1-deoxy-D-xylulose-5-phosphate synthase
MTGQIPETRSELLSLGQPELKALASTLREKIIEATLENGGHLASNLGLVEATIALERVFDANRDRIVFDTGHQCYAHKLLTGRADDFATLRLAGGVSGFTDRTESTADALYAGHSGSAVSAALGFAAIYGAASDAPRAVAVVGDGALANGMVWEALNNAATSPAPIVIVLNDNGMAISKTIGALPRYLWRITTSGAYFNFKRTLKRALPSGGVGFARSVKEFMKRVLIGENLFECMGLDYLGPVDGHDIARLEGVFRQARECERSCVVHIVTKKGRGYPPAETEPEKYHSVSPKKRAQEKPLSIDGDASPRHTDDTAGHADFSSAFGDYMAEAGAAYPTLRAVTAAMADGTGLTRFARLYPDRFCDVGIAEEHAAAFSGAMSLALADGGGARVVLALYSTFAQRIFDQLGHDVVMQGAPLLLALDRAGFVPGDGRSHQGLFDVALFSRLPGVVIWSPDSYESLRASLDDGLGRHGLTVVRYPKGSEKIYPRDEYAPSASHTFSVRRRKGAAAMICTYGRVSANADAAARMLEGEGIAVSVVRIDRICPLPAAELINEAADAKIAVFVEEGVRSGGVGEAFAAAAAQSGARFRVIVAAVDDPYPPQDSVEGLYEKFGLSPRAIAELVRGGLSRV